MHKAVVIFFASIVFVSSAPMKEDSGASILTYEFTNDGRGNYKFSYETSNGLKREEIGEVVNAGQEDEYIVVRGLYSYFGADGSIHKALYTVDENGYHETTILSATLPEAEDARPLPPELIASLLG